MSLDLLIVDDSKTVRSVMIKALGIASLDIGEVHEAEHGLEALEILGKKHVDVLLTDINMPEMTGIELLDRLVETGQIDSLAVIVVSTEGSVKRIREVLEKGAKAFVRKPFRVEKITEAILEATEAVG